MTLHNADFCMMRDAVIAALKQDRAGRESYGLADKVKRSAFLKEGVTRRRFTTAAAATFDFSGPGELLVVESGGHPDILIRIRLEGRQTIDLPALPGSHYRLPYASSQVVIPNNAFMLGSVTIASYPAKDMLSINTDSWQPLALAVPTTISGADTTVIPFPANSDIRLDSILVAYQCDATATSRRVQLRFWDHITGLVQHGGVHFNSIAADEVGFLSSIKGGTGTYSILIGTTRSEVIPLPVSSFRVGTSVRMVDITVFNGQAGDVYGFLLSGMFRGN